MKATFDINEVVLREPRDIKEHIAARMPRWKARHPGVEELIVAAMGCVVNGPGESRHADIGIAAEFKRMLDEYVARRFATGGAAPR